MGRWVTRAHLGRGECRFSTKNAVCARRLLPSGLPPLEKHFYVEAESVSLLTPEDVSEWRRVQHPFCPHPVKNEDLDVLSHVFFCFLPPPPPHKERRITISLWMT